MSERTTVVHWNDRPGDYVYIGRPSLFGNPFTAKRYGREGAIEKFRRYFLRRVLTDAEFYHEVNRLKGRVLVCHCKPLDCHGDIIASYLNAALDRSPSSHIDYGS